MTLQPTALLTRLDLPSGPGATGQLSVLPAAVRTEVTVPPRFVDGYATTAAVWTFTALVDGQEHLALGLGDWEAALRRSSVGGRAAIALLSNNPDKAAQLSRLGVRVTERVPTGVHLSEANARYLAAKVSHTSHTLDLPLVG